LAGHVKPLLCDFTKQKGQDYSNVTHMLLDPSCSGSGILSRLDYLTSEQDQQDDKEDKEQERLKGLAAFQSSMIQHAMQQFPNLRRLVYSTCSIHHEENESVVMQALSSDWAKEKGWRLAPLKEVIPTWSTRGLAQHCSGQSEVANSMIRCVPGGAVVEGHEEQGNVIDLNATNGFFLACFVRNSNNNAKNNKRNRRAKEKAREEKRTKLE
jgi:putative methyltransferase